MDVERTATFEHQRTTTNGYSIPFEEICGAFRHYYPRMTRQQEEMPLGGDFGAEGELEATGKGRKRWPTN